MGRAICQALGFLLGLSIVVRAQDPQAPQATFRTRVDVIQVDVSVLGRDRHPVSGLTAADFTLMEDGRPRPILSSTEVRVPPPAAFTAGWMADIARDDNQDRVWGTRKLSVRPRSTRPVAGRSATSSSRA